MTALPIWTDRLRDELLRRFPDAGRPTLAIAPGRVNLIGEHTDYNDGFVLPMAIDRWAGVAVSPRADRRLRAASVVFDETREAELGGLEPRPDVVEWFSYICAAAGAMTETGLEPCGVDLVVDGDVPLGSGLSSSSALVMAVLRALCAVSSIEWNPVEMARTGQRAERGFIGVEGGVMDQFTSAMGREGRALLLDCRSLRADAVELPAGAAVVVMDTGAPRTLAGSAYNERSRSCRAAVEALRRADPTVRALRDVEPGFLELEHGRLDEVTLRRARFVVDEMARPLAMSVALSQGDVEEAGRLMNASHAGLRDLYEVSSRELDLVTDLARRHPACCGARLTGAGFGGCAVALVDEACAADFIESVHTAYRAEIDLPSSFFIARAVDGARVI